MAAISLFNRPLSAGGFAARLVVAAYAVVCVPAVVGCESATLTLPTAPGEGEQPRITDLEPAAAYGMDEIHVHGTGFDPVAANNLVLFQGGLTAQGLRYDEGALVVEVPAAQSLPGPLIVETLQQRSEPSSESFIALGYGHPVFGTGVADLRFRHRPVGLVDTEEEVLLASTLLDLLVTDGGAFAETRGQPVALRRVAGGSAWLSTSSPAGGVFTEVAPTSGARIAESAAGGWVERFVLPAASGAHVARTVGVDAVGRVSLATWTREGTTLTAARTPLDVEAVHGATSGPDGTVFVVATVLDGNDTEVVVLRLGAGGVEQVWVPPELGQRPTGPVVVTPTPAGPVLAAGLAEGDLLLLDLTTGTSEVEVLVSFGVVGDLQAGTEDGKVVFTKPLDGAVFQYDVVAREIEWTVQVRGEPSMVDVAASIGEVAVANDEENVVDFIDPSTGTWLGRSSFALGLGAAEGYSEGVAFAYSYRPEAPEDRSYRVDLLARTSRMVLALDPSSLDLSGTRPLAPGASEPLRLAVTPQLRTLVIHRDEIGVVDEGPERLVIEELQATPLSVAFLGNDRVLLPSVVGVEVLEWTGDDPLTADLVSKGFWRAATGESVEALYVWDGEVVLVLRTAVGHTVEVHSALTLLGDGEPRRTVATSLPGELVGSVLLYDGPALAMTQVAQGRPALLTWSLLQSGGTPIESVVDRPMLQGASPDARYATWVDDGTGEHMVRLVRYRAPNDEGYPAGLWAYASYRLGARAAGPGFDPSGEWMFVPVPKLDMLVVVQ